MPVPIDYKDPRFLRGIFLGRQASWSKHINSPRVISRQAPIVRNR